MYRPPRWPPLYVSTSRGEPLVNKFEQVYNDGEGPLQWWPLYISARGRRVLLGLLSRLPYHVTYRLMHGTLPTPISLQNDRQLWKDKKTFQLPTFQPVSGVGVGGVSMWHTWIFLNLFPLGTHPCRQTRQKTSPSHNGYNNGNQWYPRTKSDGPLKFWAY